MEGAFRRTCEGHGAEHRRYHADNARDGRNRAAMPRAQELAFAEAAIRLRGREICASPKLWFCARLGDSVDPKQVQVPWILPARFLAPDRLFMQPQPVCVGCGASSCLVSALLVSTVRVVDQFFFRLQIGPH